MIVRFVFGGRSSGNIITMPITMTTLFNGTGRGVDGLLGVSRSFHSSLNLNSQRNSNQVNRKRVPILPPERTPKLTTQMPVDTLLFSTQKRVEFYFSRLLFVVLTKFFKLHRNYLF